MIFSTIEFLLFFVSVFGLFWLIPHHGFRRRMLLVASYIFYMSWNAYFAGLILFSTLVDYLCGYWIHHSQNKTQRKRVLIFSLCTNLGLLGFFKYFNFFTEVSFDTLKLIGIHTISTPTWDIVLPVGISFFTFQSMSYTIDIYRKQIEPHRDFFDFALFVSFFAQLVAGPIVRARDFLPQLEQKQKWNSNDFYCGLLLFFQGLFKKVIIADRVAVFVNMYYAHSDIYGATTAWLAAIGFTIQIYCDFSGYSDMAIGCARMLGFKLPENFNLPYLSLDISEFWRRWHISLSTWLRDYLYIPLGGSFKGPGQTYANLMITMLLGGLWHGANWTFILWGGYHGLLLVIHRLYKSSSLQNSLSSLGFIYTLFSWGITFLSVVVGWVIFRATSFTQAYEILETMFFFESYSYPEPATVIISSSIVLIAAHLIAAQGDFIKKFVRWPVLLQGTCIGLIYSIFIMFGQVEDQVFIYFQF